jgi:hypothetical protein
VASTGGPPRPQRTEANRESMRPQQAPVERNACGIGRRARRRVDVGPRARLFAGCSTWTAPTVYSPRKGPAESIRCTARSQAELSVVPFHTAPWERRDTRGGSESRRTVSARRDRPTRWFVAAPQVPFTECKATRSAQFLVNLSMPRSRSSLGGVITNVWSSRKVTVISSGSPSGSSACRRTSLPFSARIFHFPLVSDV